jgi:hypothetical protein
MWLKHVEMREPTIIRVSFLLLLIFKAFLSDLSSLSLVESVLTKLLYLEF